MLREEVWKNGFDEGLTSNVPRPRFTISKTAATLLKNVLRIDDRLTDTFVAARRRLALFEALSGARAEARIPPLNPRKIT